MSHDTGVTACEAHTRIEGNLVPCPATVKNNKWAKVRAADDGWYFMRDGRSWCPEHRPKWAPPWPKPADQAEG